MDRLTAGYPARMILSPHEMEQFRLKEPAVLLAAGMFCLVWSGVAPHDRTTWILETFPIFLGVPLDRKSTRLNSSH